MLQVRSPILYFFLLVLKILLNFCSDISYKQDKFFEILSKKSLEFIFNRENNTIAFNLSLLLLLVKVDSITKERGYKRDAFKTCSTSLIKIILILLTEVAILYLQALIVQVRIFGLKRAIMECRIYIKLAMFLASD